MSRRIVFSFWAYDAASDVAIDTLKELGIPYTVKTKRRLRDKSAPEDCKYDDWMKVYVSENGLVKWVKRKIGEGINSYC
jgi:hypothetical protein